MLPITAMTKAQDELERIRNLMHENTERVRAAIPKDSIVIFTWRSGQKTLSRGTVVDNDYRSLRVRFDTDHADRYKCKVMDIPFDQIHGHSAPIKVEIKTRKTKA